MVSSRNRLMLPLLRTAVFSAMLLVHFCGSSKVVTLTEESFEGFVEENANALVFFYAPWCGHCQRLHPEFEKAADRIAEDGLSATFATVDATTEKDLAARFSVQSYPTLAYIKDGQDFEYTGGRNADQLVAWVSQRESPDFNWTNLLEDRQQQDHVVTHLTASTFDAYLKNHKRVLVMFWADWCQHCMAMKPEFDKAALEVHKANGKTGMAMVQDTERQLLVRYNVEMFPWLKYVDRDTGAATNTPDLRRARELSGFVNAAEKRELQILPGDVDIQNWIERNTTDAEKFVVFFASTEGAQRLKQFHKVSFLLSTRTGFAFAASNDGRNLAPLTMYRKGFSYPDAEVVQYTGMWTVEAVKQWIVVNTYPSMGAFDEDRERYRPGIPNNLPHLNTSLFVSLDEEDDDDGFLSIREVVTTMFSKRTDSLREKGVFIAWANAGDDFTRNLLGIDESMEPQITLLTKDRNSRAGIEHSMYILRGRDIIRDETAVDTFLEDYFSGTLRPTHFKSEPVASTEPAANGITTLVGDTFDQVALDAGLSVFVKFYAPDQGPSADVEADWEEFASLAKEHGFLERGVVIAEMNGIANDCAEIVESFPKFVFYPAVKTGRKNAPGIEFKSAELKAEAFMKFIMQKTGLKYERKIESAAKSTTTTTRSMTTTTVKTVFEKITVETSHESPNASSAPQENMNTPTEHLPRLSDLQLAEEAVRLTKKLEDARAVLGFLKQTIKEKETEFMALQVTQAEIKTEAARRNSEL